MSTREKSCMFLSWIISVKHSGEEVVHGTEIVAEKKYPTFTEISA